MFSKHRGARYILIGAAVATALPLTGFAQWLNYPTPGIPRTKDGKANLSAPVPRMPDGKPDLSGIWSGPGGGSYDRNIARDLKPGDVQPWAEALYQKRVLDEGKDSPRASCLPDPFVYYHMVDVARFVQSSSVLAVMFQGTTNSVHRTIFLDGRPLPKDPNPSWMGYSTGRWEGDVLVVETGGFNDRGWLDIEGHPHTEALRITERYRRRDFGHMDLDITIDDPKTFTHPFSMHIPKTLMPDTDLIESVCENDRSPAHMLGGTGARSDPQTLSKYTGTYEYSSGQQAVIFREGELLFLRNGKNPLKFPLVPDAPNVFISRTEGDTLLFSTDSAGKVTGFVRRRGTEDQKARRIADQ